ncbi:hypothetical protein GF319_11695 [Candidatus Bathyarchaeota archaeon]|jgi:hypothetical protein|nr:hypothetical protein [Candidatus Bathyarchaeota archaeon]
MTIDSKVIKEHLADENYALLLRECKEPKSFNEIRKLKLKESVLFQALKDLKLSEALLFDDGKYYTSPEAFEYLE